MIRGFYSILKEILQKLLKTFKSIQALLFCLFYGVYSAIFNQISQINDQSIRYFNVFVISSKS
jgi:flagellar biosynthesis protein FliQ